MDGSIGLADGPSDTPQITAMPSTILVLYLLQFLSRVLENGRQFGAKGEKSSTSAKLRDPP